MRVSIVTAVRNGATTIVDALASVAAQRHPDVEHVVVDALSTDGTAAIARGHVRPGGVVVSEADAGIYDAFNKGLRLATGDVIAFLNADDFYVDDDVIGNALCALEATGADCAYGDVEYVAPDDLGRVVRRYDSGDVSVRRLRLGFMPAHPATFVRRTLYDRYGGFDTSYRIAGDFEFVARAFGRHGASATHVHRVYTRMRTGGISTRGLRSKLTISEEILRACRENGIATNPLLVNSRFLLKLKDVL